MATHFKPEPIAAARERSRVLVIEPNRRYCGALARRLGEFGYRVATADSAQKGMAELHRLPVDLVLAECRMQGTSGIELARMIREDAAYRELPVLLMVGRSDASGAIAAFESGADGVVRKPCHFEILAACIARQLERAEAMKRLSHDNAALDARIIERAIRLGEMQELWRRTEAERRRLADLVERRAA